MNKIGIIDEHKTFTRFTNVSESLDRKEDFKMFDSDQLIAKVPHNWEKGFCHGVIIPHKMKNCDKCTKDF